MVVERNSIARPHSAEAEQYTRIVLSMHTHPSLGSVMVRASSKWGVGGGGGGGGAYVERFGLQVDSVTIRTSRCDCQNEQTNLRVFYDKVRNQGTMHVQPRGNFTRVL